MMSVRQKAEDMKRKKNLVIFIYLLLLAGCLWLLSLMRMPKQDGGGPSGPVFTEGEDHAEPEKDASGGVQPADGKGAAEESGYRKRIRRDVEDIVRYINRRQKEQSLLEEARRRREREAWSEAYRRWLWLQAMAAGQKEEEQPYVPPTIMLASDLHYMSRDTHDRGRAFCRLLEGDDGKVSQYSDIIIDTLLEEALKRRPSALVLAGDNTLNGEAVNHKGLAKKLQKLADEGIAVLIIPGNHDIGNHNAAIYFGEEKKKTDYLETAEDFLEIYHSFGYDQAKSRDSASLSYVYELDEAHWMMMLDSCQYENGNKVSGRIRTETLAWMEEQFEQARSADINVVVAAHHNLLSESRLYTTECTMENHEEVISLLERYELPLYISGHLHAQRIKKHKAAPGVPDDACGITEIVLGPFSIPPCQYGTLEWDERGGMIFHTYAADIASRFAGQEAKEPFFVRQSGRADDLTEEDLRFLENFQTCGEAFVKDIRKEQVKKTLYSAPDDLKVQMSELYAGLYYNYCAGNRMEWRDVYTTKAYKFWERLCPDSRYMSEMSGMALDVREDQHDWALTFSDEERMIEITGR